MRQILIVLIALIALSIPCYAQQDPRDPGVQDSVLLDEFSVFVNRDTVITMPVYAATDDSVTFYNFPLQLNPQMNGVRFISPSNYFFPIVAWDDHFDTVMISQGYILQLGFCDLGGDANPALNTNHVQIHIWDIRIEIDSSAHSGLYVIDTTWDSRNGSILFGLADGITGFKPAVRSGYIYVNPYGVESNEPTPAAFSLSQNYPNPFNSSTEIEFSLPASGPVSLVIYDIQGREIRRLLDCNLEPESHSVIWNGLNDYDGPVSSGIYFYRLNSGNASQTNRMTLLR
jgi:hypothetical protein